VKSLRVILWIAVAAAAVAIQSDSPSDGKQLFTKRCSGCHSLDRDLEGPRLRGVYGRKAGAVKSFQYSDALRKAGITWDGETLDKWLADTETVAPNNGMAFRVESADERKSIIEYLKQIK
jgi:cytochrome c